MKWFARTRTKVGLVALGAGALTLAAFSITSRSAHAVARAKADGEPHISAADPIAAGRYLVKIGGCNDCHTPGYSQSGGNVPESHWLTGNSVGFRGPWGTSYASNLRLYVAPMSEEDWMKIMRSRDARPPMPWISLHAMADDDLRAVYRFIKSLGKGGDPSPQPLPPGQEPTTPYVLMAPHMPSASGKQ